MERLSEIVAGELADHLNGLRRAGWVAFAAITGKWTDPTPLICNDG